MTDFVIVGGGVYGVATAWWLAREGASVCVVEERDVAARASGGPGRRGVRANGRDGRELPLMAHAYERWPELHEVLGSAPFFERTGHLLLAETEAECERLRAQAWLQRAQGIDTELLDGDAAREREPGLSGRIRMAARCALDGVADQSATTRAYAAAAARLGVTITTQTRVASIETRAGRATGVVTTDGGRIEAERGVMVLANSAVGALLAPWMTLPVWNVTLHVLISAPMHTVPFSHLTGHVGRRVSLKTEGPDRVMISGGWRGVWDAAREEGTPVAAAVEGNVAEAVMVYPGLEGLRVDIADAGHQEAYCVDDIPAIDRIEGMDNAWYATGWCGHGWAIAPVVSELLGDWALTGRRPPLLAPFAHQRFTSPAGQVD